jgi:hypothetical protein
MFYQKKYLKYKNKYLDLKKQFAGASSSGGGGASASLLCSNCPLYGFNNYAGECWNDSLMMILCFTDGISENIQKIFNNIDLNDPRELTKLVENKVPDDDYLLPLNISIDKKDDFNMFSLDYIKAMYNRYKIEITHIEREKTEKKQLKKQDSFDLSLTCVERNYNIYNINKIETIPFDKDANQHGTNESLNNIMTINMINYFLMNYLVSEEQPKKYMCFEIWNTERNNGVEHLRRLITKSNAILCSIKKRNTEMKFVNGGFISEDHQICFFKCLDKYYLFDDNGINDSEEFKTNIIEFNWKDYLLNCCDVFTTVNLENWDILSEFIHGHEIKYMNEIRDKQYGAAYLKDWFISELQPIFIDNVYDFTIGEYNSYFENNWGENYYEPTIIQENSLERIKKMSNMNNIIYYKGYKCNLLDFAAEYRMFDRYKEFSKQIIEEIIKKGGIGIMYPQRIDALLKYHNINQ